MAVENATTIDELNTSLPSPTDPVEEGDDHLRLLKSVLKAQLTNLPNVINWAIDITQRFVNIENRLDAVEDTLNNDVVKFDTGTDNLTLTGVLTANSMVCQTSLNVAGATTLQSVSFTTATGNTITADNINATVELTSNGNVVAFDP